VDANVGRMKEWAKKALAVLIGLLVALLMSEGLLRLLPVQGAYFRIPVRPSDEVGFTRIPETSCQFESSCFRIADIRFNSLGFRDREFSAGGEFKIAILGDSFMEAIEVPAGLTTASILEKLVHRPVLNSAINSYGTSHQLFVYRNFLKILRPKIVLLFFYPGNDIQENSCQLTKMYGESISGPCGDISDEKVMWRTNFDTDDHVRGQSALKDFLRQHCKVCLLGYRTLKAHPWNRSFGREIDFSYNAFRSEPPEAVREPWENGWRITEAAITQLNSEVTSNGGRLFIVTVPHFFAVIPDWKKAFKESTGQEVPDDFDPLLAEKRLSRLGAKLSVPVVNLDQGFNRYRVRNELKDPYFWYFCDAHWSPLGHFIAANVVAKALLDSGAVDVTENEKNVMYLNIHRNLNLSPLDILGETAYNEIYRHGMYRGASNIPEILAHE
jgi:hypothetical protein